MKAPLPLLSLVVPCYNEEEALPILYEELTALAFSLEGRYRLEFVFVDDGSSDGTLDTLAALLAQDSRVRYLSFSRNFGKEAALLAGLRASRGDYVGVLDADLQDPPSLIPEMLDAVASGQWDCAATKRSTRKGEPFLRSLFAHAFYRLMNRISDAHIVDGARDFRIMNRVMTDAVLSMPEYNRFSKGLFSWVGFRTRWFEYDNVPRSAGSTKWSFVKLVAYSFEGISAFSTFPLAIASAFGMLFCLAAFVMIAAVIVKTLIWGDPVAGYPSMMSVILFMGGIQLFTIGILGQYLAKTYLESKKRPPYVVREEKP